MYRNIVFAYDGSAECRDALTGAMELVAACRARCYLLAVVRSLSPLALSAGSAVPETLIEEEQARVRAILDVGVEHLRQAGFEAEGALKYGDSPAKTIGSFATEVGADLVVVGHRRRSVVERWWHGSVGHSLLDNVPCSLLVSMPRTATI